jgi:hypothetical protein
MKKLLLACLATSLLALTPTVAHADTYAPSPVDQDFVGGPGGWTQATSYSQLCVQPLLCPTVSDTWKPGGADGNGYLSTAFGSVAETVPGTATGVWSSPAFTYNGLNGKVPGRVTFDLNIYKNLSALLNLSLLNDAQFSVDLIDQGTGNGVTVVPSTLLTQSSGWVAIPSASINPALLAIGHNYKIQITTTYHAAVVAVASGEVGYDNVRLTTGTGSDDGSRGPNSGSGITTTKQLRELTKHYILPKTAKVSGRQLKVKLRCPAIAAPKPCQIQFQGLRAGRFSPPATARKVIKIRPDHTRVVRVRIKPQFVTSYHHFKKIWVKCTVRVGNVKVTVHRRMKLK